MLNPTVAILDDSGDRINGPYGYDEIEAFGLELRLVGTWADQSEVEQYRFDEFLVAVDPESGVWYWASDTGCSCPSPFEDLCTLSDLNAVTGTQQIMKQFSLWLSGTSENKRRAERQLKRVLMGLT